MKYKFNHKSLSFEKAEKTLVQRLKIVLSHTTSAIVFAVIVVVVWDIFFESPKEKQLKRELEENNRTIEDLEQRLNLLANILKDFEEKDKQLYRAVFETNPSNNKRLQSQLDQYFSARNNIEDDKLSQLQLKADMLTILSQEQLKSYQELYALALKKDSLATTIPAICPVKNLTILSGFGSRYHPIYKILKRHTGVDLAGKKGTPVYATADGVVSDEMDGYSGYGILVLINHGNGYKTLYAHLSKKNVRHGQKVKRGEVIGYIGNTGLSVSPHLHYEVIKDGEKVNPIHYFFGDLSPEEYQAILEQAAHVNRALS